MGLKRVVSLMSTLRFGYLGMRQTINLQLEIISFAIIHFENRKQERNPTVYRERILVCYFRVSLRGRISMYTVTRGTMIGRDIQKHAKLIGRHNAKELERQKTSTFGEADIQSLCFAMCVETWCQILS
jgi:hypothetical protein